WGAKLLDCGRANGSARADPAGSMQATRSAPAPLTDPGNTVGTMAYMSPEQLRGEDLDARTDLFSLGLVLYEMATGTPAFTGDTTAVVGGAILHQEARPPREIRPELPERLQDVVLKATEQDRALRYQHASEIRADLQRLKRDTASVHVTPGAIAATPRRRPRRLLMLAAAALVVVLGASVAIYFYAQRVSALTDKDTIVLAEF